MRALLPGLPVRSVGRQDAPGSHRRRTHRDAGRGLTAFILPGPLWLAGCGNMAGAMLEGWLAAGRDPSQITVIRPSGAPVAGGVRVLTGPPEDEVPAILMLGMKPQKLAEAAPPFAS